MGNDKEDGVTEEKTYTEAEVEQRISRAISAHEISAMREALAAVERSRTSQYGDIQNSIEKVYTRMEAKFELLRTQTNECRDDLERDIAAQFATKAELEELRGEIKQLWGKITAGVAVAVLLINIGFEMWDSSHRNNNHHPAPTVTPYK